MEAAALFRAAPVATLATVRPDGAPHIVPVVFAMPDSRDDLVYTAVDGKPKSTRRLRRLANIEATPLVSLLADHYDDDWSRLWWVRADGAATVHHDGPELKAAHDVLRRKYIQYESIALEGPAIVIEVHRWAHWAGG